MTAQSAKPAMHVANASNAPAAAKKLMHTPARLSPRRGQLSASLARNAALNAAFGSSLVRFSVIGGL